MPDGTKRKNYINLSMNNFNISECGDLQDMVNHMDSEGVGALLANGDEIPDL